MAKSQQQNMPTKVTPPVGSLASSRPEHIKMTKEAQGVLDLARQYVVVPRVKMVQKQSSAALLANFNPGTLILSPEQSVIIPGPDARDAKEGPPFFFIPLLFWPEWATWNPYELKDSMPAVEYRTLDRNDPIVAKSRDAKLRLEPLRDSGGAQQTANGKPLFRRHVEHLNWLVLLVDHPIKQPIALTFARGEHFAGMKFNGLVRGREAAPYGCVFQGNAAWRPPKNGGDWWGIDVTNPSAESNVSPWVQAEQYAAIEAVFTEWRKTQQSQVLQANLDNPDDLVASDTAGDGGGGETASEARGGRREL